MSAISVYKGIGYFLVSYSSTLLDKLSNSWVSALFNFLKPFSIKLSILESAA
jgi:hypothetical protein